MKQMDTNKCIHIPFARAFMEEMWNKNLVWDNVPILQELVSLCRST